MPKFNFGLEQVSPGRFHFFAQWAARFLGRAVLL
jgi:hypothetical protein